MSDLRGVEMKSRYIEPTRSVIRTKGSKAIWHEAEQLDSLVLYVARCLEENIKANIAQAEGSSAARPLPVDFPDPALNALLGLKAKGDDDSPQKAMSALHEAVVRFTKTVGVEQDFVREMQSREEFLAANYPSPPRPAPPTWPEARDRRIRAALDRKAFHANECDLAEKEATALKAPPGFAGTKWRMYPAEVKSIRPKTALDAEGNVSESMVWLGRPVTVKYGFDNVFDKMPSSEEIVVNGLPSFLVTVTVTFSGAATSADFGRTQDFLQSEHGNMPAPNKTGEYLLASHYKQGRISIWHRLSPNNTEEVLFAREVPR